jgi:hypothetical protein
MVAQRAFAAANSNRIFSWLVHPSQSLGYPVDTDQSLSPQPDP